MVPVVHLGCVLLADESIVCGSVAITGCRSVGVRYVELVTNFQSPVL